MKELEYPFDSEYILKKKKSIRRNLLEKDENRISKKVAILGGSTTNNVKLILEIFLLNYGIKPIFYESEYNQYYEDIVFDNANLAEFQPDIIYIHTSIHNIKCFPNMEASKEEVEVLLEEEYSKYEMMWKHAYEKYQCPIIQNNFEWPSYRLLGNADVSDIHGKVYFVSCLNHRFSKYAQSHAYFYINDINYLSSCYGLDKWSDLFYWNMYKYSCAVDAIPELAFNIAKIIKAIYGKNKKGLVLDLDNTLWGGIVGDDGVEKLEIGQETPMGQAYAGFQTYIKELKSIGVLLTVNSKNELENAVAGLEHPDGVIRKDDFLVIKANWQSKDRNLVEIADELNILPDSLVFVDDNPAERSIVEAQVSNVQAPEMKDVNEYIRVLDKSGFFETVSLSKDDLIRNQMYKDNLIRKRQMATYEKYEDYLLSLEMKGRIKPFEEVYLSRITQLTNKSNQFNLTTKRYSQSDIEKVWLDDAYITLYGKLEDKFGDNGVVSVIIGSIDEKEVKIQLWLMSCRVLKRNMEFAMMDALVEQCKTRGIDTIRGFYYPTAKNAMVKDFYELQGFEKVSENEVGDTEWLFQITDTYIKKNTVISVEEE